MTNFPRGASLLIAETAGRLIDGDVWREGRRMASVNRRRRAAHLSAMIRAMDVEAYNAERRGADGSVFDAPMGLMATDLSHLARESADHGTLTPAADDLAILIDPRRTADLHGNPNDLAAV